MSEYLNIVVASKPQVISESKKEGLYEISGLYPGYGNTLGNALRRMLISSIPGTALTTIRIRGVQHEFSTLSGVKEDTLIIIINMKNIKIKSHTDEFPQTITLKKQGKGKVTAGDFECPSQVEIINKDLVIAEITDDKTTLEIEADVYGGIGFRSREDINATPEVGSIIVDAVFSPVKRSYYEVENMRVGDRTDFNKLQIFIETDGSITPRAALDTAIRTIITQMEAMTKFQGDKGESINIEEVEKEVEEHVKEMHIEELGLSESTIRNLENGGIKTMADLLRKGGTAVKEIGGIGEKKYAEIISALEDRGVVLKDE